MTDLGNNAAAGNGAGNGGGPRLPVGIKQIESAVQAAPASTVGSLIAVLIALYSAGVLPAGRGGDPVEIGKLSPEALRQVHAEIVAPVVQAIDKGFDETSRELRELIADQRLTNDRMVRSRSTTGGMP